jgi:hypothetical protein
VTRDQAKLLRIYLDDHHAILVGGRELVRRMSRTANTELLALLTELVPELEDDRGHVVTLLRQAGGSPSSVKSGAAWLAEKAGRLKPNGSLTTPTALTPLLELEGLRFVLDASRSLWHTLERTHAKSSDHAERAVRAERRLEQIEQLRLAAAERAFR